MKDLPPEFMISHAIDARNDSRQGPRMQKKLHSLMQVNAFDGRQA